MSGDDRIVTGRFTAAAASCFFMTLVFFAHFSAMPSFSMDRMGTDAALAGFVAGVFILGDIVGRIVLRNRIWLIGPNRLCLAMMAAGTGISVLYLMTDDVTAICTIGVIHGFTYGVAELCVFARVTADLPESKRGKGIGLFTLSYSLACAIGPFLSIYMVNSGSYDEVFILGLVASALSAASAVLMGRDTAPEDSVESEDAIVTGIIPGVLPISVVTLLFLISYSGVLTFIAPFGISEGFEDYAAAFYIVLAAATVFSRVSVMGRYDELGPDRILVPMLLLYVVGMVILGLASEGYLILISAFLIGLALASVQAASQVIAVEGLHPKEQGTALAVVQVAIDLSYIIGPVAYGIVLSGTDYAGSYLLMGLVGLVPLLLYLAACSQVRKKKVRIRERRSARASPVLCGW